MDRLVLLLMAILSARGQFGGPEKPDNVLVTAKSSNCVALSWQRPKAQANGIGGYEYKCSGNSSWQQTDNSDSHEKEVCGYRPYTEVSCSVRALSNVFNTSTMVQSNAVVTYCAAPGPPTNLQANRADRYEYSGGFKTWQYNVTWQPPTAVNCLSMNRYPARYQVGRKSSIDMYRNYALFSLNAGETITFSVRARNNQGSLSKKALIEIHAPAASPSKPTSVHLESNSTNCVTLKWSSPYFSNGKITKYEYKCTNAASWVTTGNASSRSATVCGYTAYTSVACTIRAINAAKNPGESTNLLYTHTSCDVPEQPINVKLVYHGKAIVKADGRRIWNCTAMWQKPKRTNCGSLHAIHPYKYKVNQQAETYTNQTSLNLLAVAGAPIRFAVSAKNSGNLDSKWSYIEEKTPQTEPSKPILVSLLTGSTECVTLKWKKPVHTNGNITGYQYKCTGDDKWAQTDNSESHSARICGYQPSSKVACSVRAISKVGVGDILTTGVVYTFSVAWSAQTTTPKQQRYTRRPTFRLTGTPVSNSTIFQSTTPADLTSPCPGNNNRCSANAYCVFDDKYKCICKDGFTGDGQQCSDVDECKADRHYCDNNAKCINTYGSFSCQCTQGYVGDGLICRDIDECADKINNCDSNAMCINTPGSFKCKCKPSYSGNGVTCEAGLPCPDNGLTCSIHGLCGFNPLVANYYCSCKEGFTGNGTNCADIDECTKNMHSCDENEECMNKNGTFKCVCKENYSWNGVTCTDERTPCPRSETKCSRNAHCIFDGSHKCICKKGFKGNGTICDDVNECKTGKNNCDENAICINNIGSFRCVCKMNFSGDGVHCY